MRNQYVLGYYRRIRREIAPTAHGSAQCVLAPTISQKSPGVDATLSWLARPSAINPHGCEVPGARDVQNTPVRRAGAAGSPVTRTVRAPRGRPRAAERRTASAAGMGRRTAATACGAIPGAGRAKYTRAAGDARHAAELTQPARLHKPRVPRDRPRAAITASGSSY